MVDRHGDPLPDGALARLGTVRLRHGDIISGAVFSGDGKSIIASDFGSGVHVWDVAEGREVRRFFRNDQYCNCLAMSPDGRTLAVALGDLTIRLCDPTTGREIGSLPKERDRLHYLVFSPDGSLLATATGHETVRVYDVATRQLAHRVTFTDRVGSISFSSDGKLLACGVKDGIRLWDLALGAEVGHLPNDPPDGTDSLSAAFAPRGGPLAVWGYEDGSVRLFDAKGLKEVRRLNREGAAVKPPKPWGWGSGMSVRFSPDGKALAIAREAGRIELWDAGSGTKRHALVGDTSDRASVLAFSPDGTRLASAGYDAWGGDNTIRVWDLALGKELHPRPGHGAPISSAAISPTGKAVATAGRDGVVHLWEPGSGRHLVRLEAERGRRPQVLISSDGRRLISWGTYGSAGTLRVWDAKTARAVSRLDLPGPDGFWETVSDDGRTAVSVDLKAKLVRFHGLPTGKITREVADDFHRPLALSPAGDRLVGLDGALMTVAGRKELVKIDEIHGGNSGVRFSTDGRRVIAATMDRNRPKYLSEPPAREVAVVDTVERKELRRFGNRGERYYVIEAVALSGDGKTAVTAERSGRKLDEQVITLWETETGRERGSFVGHIGAVTSVAVSADGRLVVTGAADTTALVWDATRPPVRHASVGRGPATTELAAYVRDLAGDNAEQAYASVWELVGAPKEAVAFLGEQRALFERADGQAIRRWIGDLDSDKYPERERASQELGLILDEAEPQLKKALSGNPSAEARRRIELLLQARSAGITGRELQRLRVVEVLEHIATPGAFAVLRKLAAGPPDSRPTNEAKAALARLERRAAEE